jgi:hypothetical protein
MKYRIVEHIEIDSKYYTIEKKIIGIFWVSIFHQPYKFGSPTPVTYIPVTYSNIGAAKDSLDTYIAYKILKNKKNIILSGEIK